MKSILIELHYLPSVAFFSQIAQYEEVIIESCENYQKGSYRNRCQILGANGVLSMSIPLEKGKHQQTPIRDVRINYVERWQTQHWQSIRSAYGRAPFWEFYGDYFEPIYQKKYEFLFDFNIDLFQTCCKLLKINSKISFNTHYAKDIEHPEIIDFRNQIKPNQFFPTPKYPQIFEDRFGFVPDLSIIDLMFCMGNQAKGYLSKL
jgi:WbqC-like protein family